MAYVYTNLKTVGIVFLKFVFQNVDLTVLKDFFQI